MKRCYNLAHDFGLRVMQHSCGSVRSIVPDLIEIGPDILDPIQMAAEMDLPGLLRDFGRDLGLHGGIDTQTTLPFGTPDDVREVVWAAAT